MSTLLASSEWREQCALKLQSADTRAGNLTAFVGLDGFVDEIIHVVDKRDSPESFQRLPTIAKLAKRIAAAADKSTNFELVSQRIKLGGNGPIMANALSQFGLRVTYLGALGFPHLHPQFEDLAGRAEVHSIAEPGHTDALEFEDGKIMLTKTRHFTDLNWANIQARYGRKKFAAKFAASDLVAFVNWTMVPHMSDLWGVLQQELCPSLKGPRRLMFFDLADPEKRTLNDLSQALQLIIDFNKYFDVILGCNEKEAFEVGKVLGVAPKPHNPDGLAALAAEINRRVATHTLVVHPVAYALSVTHDTVHTVKGPFVDKPVITTGAGDHFNAGFCLGRLLRLDNPSSLLLGVASSGFYVRSGQSPSINDLVKMLRNWPDNESGG